MPQVPARVRKARAARLRAAGEAARASYLEGRVGSPASVLVERHGFGHDEYFATVRLEGAAAAGTIVPARVTGVEGGELLAEPSPGRGA
jgi:threonylcarbamoyladenosine tRNA methylthiotransferase MtaB